MSAAASRPRKSQHKGSETAYLASAVSVQKREWRNAPHFSLMRFHIRTAVSAFASLPPFLFFVVIIPMTSTMMTADTVRAMRRPGNGVKFTRRIVRADGVGEAYNPSTVATAPVDGVVGKTSTTDGSADIAGSLNTIAFKGTHVFFLHIEREMTTSVIQLVAQNVKIPSVRRGFCERNLNAIASPRSSA